MLLWNCSYSLCMMPSQDITKGVKDPLSCSTIPSYPVFFFCLIDRDRIPSLGGVGFIVCICDANIKKRCSARLPKSWNCNISYQTGFISLRVAFFLFLSIYSV
uniref:Uncharacterized protein n=1 Tax=Cacopsylla melanoneura TaxID=428564 RepID=A0A8D8YKH2_9HEMI